MMGWVWLYAGVIASVAASPLMKMSKGFEHLGYGAAAMALYILALVFWGYAIKTLPLTVAYAIWTGGATLLIAIISITWFDEVFTPLNILFILMILIGCIGLNVITKV